MRRIGGDVQVDTFCISNLVSHHNGSHARIHQIGEQHMASTFSSLRAATTAYPACRCGWGSKIGRAHV